jgi:hypothetical protein
MGGQPGAAPAQQQLQPPGYAARRASGAAPTLGCCGPRSIACSLATSPRACSSCGSQGASWGPRAGRSLVQGAVVVVRLTSLPLSNSCGECTTCTTSSSSAAAALRQAHASAPSPSGALSHPALVWLPRTCARFGHLALRAATRLAARDNQYIYLRLGNSDRMPHRRTLLIELENDADVLVCGRQPCQSPSMALHLPTFACNTRFRRERNLSCM